MDKRKMHLQRSGTYSGPYHDGLYITLCRVLLYKTYITKDRRKVTCKSCRRRKEWKEGE